MKKKTILILLTLLFSLEIFAQNNLTWDNTTNKNWSSAFSKVEITSSLDEKRQKAYLYASKSKIKKPLIVSLHTWSGDYSQKDPLSKEIVARDWNYIHPDFRGANHTPKSTGSKYVISDIEDAITYALKNTNSNPDEVHVIGGSGGGYATLLAYMNIKYPVNTFSAWAPISDLEDWYWESVGRKQKYADDIMKAISTNENFNKEEADKRSPLKQKFPIELRKNSQLFIYEGIHDGYTGSVPITHSINMYNRLVGELKYGYLYTQDIQCEKETNLVSQLEIINLLSKRTHPNVVSNKKLFDRQIHLYKKYENISLTIFEGTHEQIPQALGLIPYNSVNNKVFNILTIGDSNGANLGGWVDQLKKIIPKSFVYNISKGGRTIGFNNLGRKELNTLANIDDYLEEAKLKIGNKNYDFIIVCLGTNDTKRVYKDLQHEVPNKFKKLLSKINNHHINTSKTKLIFVTPPPIRTHHILEKYQGGNKRLEKLIPLLSKIAEENHFELIDVYHPLLGVVDYYAQDGIHMDGKGQEIIANKIIEKITK